CIAISVLIVAGNWVKKHNVMDLIGWVFSLTLVSMLVVIRTPVQIIDYSNVAQVYEVDNVPIGLAIPASLTTRVGNALIQSYEMVFALPDSVTYSKTGMLFGSNLVAKSTDFLSQNPQITTLFSDYVQNCVMGDIFLNHKYSFEELLNSPDPYTLIFANPSPLRGVFDKNNQFQTCEEASRDLKSALALDTQTGGKTWNYYVRQLFGGKPNSFGQMSRQLANGGMSTQTRDGSMVWDSGGAMSKLPVDINVGRQIASAQQQMAREADVQAESALHGYNSSVTSAWNSLQQFGTNKGNSTSTTTGADTTESSQDSMARSKMWNAVVANAKANNISNEESFQQLMDKSTKGAVSGEIYGGGKWSSGDQLAGKLGKLATGFSAEGGFKGSVALSGTSGSTDSTTESGRESHDSRHDTSSQAAKDFKEASDYFTSRKTTTSGNITDNNASSRVDQFAASLSSAKNSYDQYTTSRTRSHEYSEMASRTESMSGQMNENLTQQFANFVQHRAPQDAEAILTNTSSPEIAAQREALAREFVKEQVEPRVDAAYQQGRESIGQNMAGVSGGGDNGSVMADYGQNSGRIDAMTQDAGIKDNVGQKVDGMIAENKQQHKETRENIQQQGVEVKKENAELENDHKTKGNDFKNTYNNKKESQTKLPGADTTKELLDKARKLENETSKR
ncbi:conjugal transfer protein TraG N-terminal domain-containing protein, partial [Klebsiella michiganensis]|uniref:conjugal transfer protein TraG N-terminal domain-containing protein n=1 Tax=Klebsiella michiganensis TaxID=1134687 RepID=UPI00398424F9